MPRRSRPRTAARAALLVSSLLTAGSAAAAPAASGPNEILRLTVGAVPASYAKELASGDGYHFAYLVRADGVDVWTKDGRKLPPTPRALVDLSNPGLVKATMSRDGALWAAVVAVSDENGAPKGQAVLANGSLGPLYDEITSLVVSPLGSRTAYAARRGSTWRIVADSAEGPEFPGTPGCLQFNAKGGALAYVADAGDGLHLYLDQKPVDTWPGQRCYLSEDWGRYAAVGPDPTRAGEQLVLDQKVYGPYTSIVEVAFSSDDSRVGYFASDIKTSEYNAYFDGVKTGPALKMFSGGGMRFNPGDGSAYWLGSLGLSRVTLFQEDTPQGTWDFTEGYPPLVFSPLGKHMALMVRDGSGRRALVDGAALAALPLLSLSSIVFDDEREFHYLGKDGSKVVLVCARVGALPRIENSVCAANARRLYPGAFAKGGQAQ